MISRRDFFCIASTLGALRADDLSLGADRLMWQRTNPDFPIYLPSGYADRTNQQVVAAHTPRGTLIVTWTMGEYESAPDHRPVVSRSTDDGRTWSNPLVLDCQDFDKKGAGDGKRAQYSFPFVVRETGRIYIFYSKNTGQSQVREDTTAVLKFAYSDDDGVSWQRGHVIPLPRCEWSHPDPKADPNWISIYAPIRTKKDTVICGVGRYKAGPDLYKGWPKSTAGSDRETELVFFRFDNILEERGVPHLKVSVSPEGSRGLRIPRKDDPAHVWSNEPCLTTLSDGRIFVTIRTRNDAVYYTLSADEGRTWNPPRSLCYTNGGEVMENSNAPCPVIRLADGRIVLMYYHCKNGATQFGSRDPVYLAVGRETLNKPQPVEFGRPRLFMDIHGKLPPGDTSRPQIASYSSFLEHKGKLYLFYNDCKYFILGKVVPEDLLRA
jgi:hypothetical protein